MSDTNERGEPVYATILRNRSGMDAGEIDMSVSVFEIQEMCEGDRQSICDTAYAMYQTICDYSGKVAKNDGG